MIYFMEGIVLQDNFAYIYLDVDFYNENNILKTISVYVDFMDAQVKKFGKYNVVKIIPKTDEFSLDILTREFSNYLLSTEYSG